MESPACAGCRERDHLIADLRRHTSQLEAQVERPTRLLEKAQRDGKRQAAPFAKGPPQHEPKGPGCKPSADYGLQGSSPAPRPPATRRCDAPIKCLLIKIIETCKPGMGEMKGYRATR